MTISQKELSAKSREGLVNLARNRKLYRIKTEVVGSDGIKNTFLTFSKACDLLQSKLHDFLTIQLDSNLVVLGVNHRPVTLEDDFGSNCESIGLDRINEFSTVVTFKNTEQARVPDTGENIQRLNFKF
jgi:ER membrane protein complex subunit 10